MYRPLCVKPLLLFNKYCLTLVQNGGLACFDGYFSKAFPPVHELLQSVRNLKDDILDNYYVIFDDVKENMFLFVPCMHCDLCLHSKQVDYINRSILETLQWDCPPMFATLTYKESDIPCLKVGVKRYSVGELRYKDFQDFMKRLRSRWTRKGLKHDVRYLVAGEYGSDPRFSHRPHFHMILWNNPYNCSELDKPLFDELKEDLFETWSHCVPDAFDFGQCRGGAAPYATKYCCKPSLTYGHINKPFIRCSSGKRGGLGSIYINSVLPYLRSNPNINYLEYVDKSGKYGYMFFSKTLSKKIWPSPSASVSPHYRHLFRQLCDCLSSMIYIRAISYDYAVELANILRPSVHVRIDIKRPKFLSLCKCPIYYSFFFKILKNTFNILSDELSVVCNDVDVDYIKNYYLRRDLFTVMPASDMAQKLVRLREKTALVLYKQKL